MAEPKHEFTDLSKLVPEAIGKPGKRVFRILVESSSSAASIWLEKEQLFQLALAVHQLTTTLQEGEDSLPDVGPSENEAPPLTKLDFKAGRIFLRHDVERAMFMIDAHEIETDGDEPPVIRFWAARAVMEEFAEEAIRVCSSGRPSCPLCGGPIDPEGHNCPRVNGHHGKISDIAE